MEYRTYIDESGNTGPNLLDEIQRYFTLAAVSVPVEKEERLAAFIEQQFMTVKEIGETEIKAVRWIRAAKRSSLLVSIWDKMQDEGCFFSTIIVEKRYMASAMVVDNFLDGAFNDVEDYTWCIDKQEKIKAAQYFYDVLSDDDVRLVMLAFSSPSKENFSSALTAVLEKTDDERYKRMLA